MFVDLHSNANTENFLNAAFYRKKAIVKARKVTVPENLQTRLQNGLLETERIVPVGEWVVTNPSGEEYAIAEDKFDSRYDYVSEGSYRAKGLIRAFPNPTGQDVEILAPWGEKQFGKADCLFAAGVDDSGNLTSDRYLIGGTEFAETYTMLTGNL